VPLSERFRVHACLDPSTENWVRNGMFAMNAMN
jgi:hypothetical protein